ncbi:hypothetical protein QZH41_010133 [Actinostola sp. cb2023]|nr:hypothetical protein QZH41_010133 [Actinostola sp. cb2023]
MFEMVNDKKPVPDGLNILFEEQKKQLNTKSKNGHRWHPRIIKLCLEIYSRSPKTLQVLRGFLVLPSERIIRYYKNSIEEMPGSNTEVNWCRKEAERRNLKEEDYWGGFLLDEMTIQVKLSCTILESIGGRWVVPVSVCKNDIYNTICTQGNEAEVATHLLQFVFISDSGFRFPIAHFPVKQTSPAILYEKFWEVVLWMKIASFR